VVREVTRYGGGEQGLRRARAAALLMLALPGGAYVFQGDELGLEEVTDLPEELLQDPTWERSGHTVRGRDGCRVPIPWERSGPSLGFGGGPGWLPQPEHWSTLSVAAQSGVDGSTLELYRAALGLRRGLRGETLDWLDSDDAVLAFRREYDGAGAVVCMVNLGAEPTGLPAGELLLVSDALTAGSLPADTAAWLRVTP
jgi:alpha-glucosidase